ncbi:MAG: hypothetical protein NT118_01920, partial [Lentisphaerae bacterium]|nr:hypothetical protein [Lentisphaerota bacterium]
MNSLGKDKWISTETSDLEKAKLIQFTFFEKNVAAKASLNIEKTPDKIAGKLTKAIYEDITGKKESRMKIADIHEN